MSKRKRKSDSSEEQGGCPGWMMTFGDIMSLLLTFFVLLISFSSFDKPRLSQAIGSLKSSLGVLPVEEEKLFGEKAGPRLKEDTATVEEKGASEGELKLKKSAQKIKDYFKGTGMYDSIKIELLKEGIAIRILNPLLFSLGKAGLRPESFPVLERIIDLIKDLPNDIDVEGHTDNLPINTLEFPSNWELSAARSVSVINYFMDKGGIPGARLGAVGYGDSRPVAPNDTPAARALNRRVEILIVENR